MFPNSLIPFDNYIPIRPIYLEPQFLHFLAGLPTFGVYHLKGFITETDKRIITELVDIREIEYSV